MNREELKAAFARTDAAAREWEVAIARFQSEIQRVRIALITEAVANRMSASQVAEISDMAVRQVRSVMRAAGLDPKWGQRLLAKQAASALVDNANLLGIDPQDMDLTSPLAYLPMGQELRALLEAEAGEAEEEPVVLTPGTVLRAVVGEDTDEDRVITATLRVVGWTASPGRLVVAFEDAK